MIVLSVLVFAILNYGIYENEQLKTHGETVLLELVPVDPRSLIQGDYMRLGYTIEAQASDMDLKPLQKRGYIVIRPDENAIGRFVRFYDEEPLTADEKLLHFHKQHLKIRIMPNSFFFQEGHAEYYENAKYGVFVFDDSGKHLLVGLADKHKELISPL